MGAEELQVKEGQGLRAAGKRKRGEGGQGACSLLPLKPPPHCPLVWVRLLLPGVACDASGHLLSQGGGWGCRDLSQAKDRPSGTPKSLQRLTNAPPGWLCSRGGGWSSWWPSVSPLKENPPCWPPGRGTKEKNCRGGEEAGSVRPLCPAAPSTEATGGRPACAHLRGLLHRPGKASGGPTGPGLGAQSCSRGSERQW